MSLQNGSANFLLLANDLSQLSLHMSSRNHILLCPQDDDEGTTMLMDLAKKKKNARKAKRETEKKPLADDAGKYAHCPSGCFTMFKGK